MEANDPHGSFLAELEEDEQLDDGTMEIDFDKEFHTWMAVGLISCGIFR